MKSFLLGLLSLCVIAFISFLFFWFWPSQIKDSLVSGMISSRFHIPMRFHRVSFDSSKALRFDSMEVLHPHDKSPIFSSGVGHLRETKMGAKPGFIFNAEDAVWHVAFGKEASQFIAWPKNLYENTIGFKHVQLYARGDEKQSSIRILEASSSDISLRGGLVLRGRKLEKMSVSGFLSREIFSKLPAVIFHGAKKKTAGVLKLRLTYGGETVTLMGPDGPMFQFSGKVSL